LTIPGRLNLPNNTSLSADADNETHWLRIQRTDNGSYKSLAALDLWCEAGQLTSGTIVNKGAITTGAITTGGITTGSMISNGHISTKTFNSGDTWFAYTDGKNYIRGTTILDGSLTHNGSSNVTGNLTAGNIRKGTVSPPWRSDGGVISSVQVNFAAMTDIPVVCANVISTQNDTNMFSVTVSNITKTSFILTALFKDGRNSESGGGWLRSAKDICWIAIS